MATWTSCLIVGGDLCGDPAFECLVLDDGRPLGLTLALDYLSSLPASQKQAAEAVAQRSRAGLDAVVIAAPFHSAAARQRFADLNAIELGPSDLDRLTDSFERSSSSTGADASLTALRSDAVRNARLLSVLAHGAYDARNSPDLERPSVVILASAEGHDGIVRSADFEQLQVPPFVELLACGPARGPARLGDAVASHLVGACFTAGADTVLAARVDVELEPTIEFASVMHRRMREFGLPPDRAALEARREIATRPERADPWYWAALQVHGIGWVPLFDARPKSSRTPLLMAAAAVIGITAAAGGFALSRRRARRHQ
jgi:CHAT domain-containing protein